MTMQIEKHLTNPEIVRIKNVLWNPDKNSDELINQVAIGGIKEGQMQVIEIFKRDGDEVISAVVNFYIPDKSNQTRAFALWNQFKQALLKETEI